MNYSTIYVCIQQIGSMWGRILPGDMKIGKKLLMGGMKKYNT